VVREVFSKSMGVVLGSLLGKQSARSSAEGVTPQTAGTCTRTLARFFQGPTCSNASSFLRVESGSRVALPCSNSRNPGGPQSMIPLPSTISRKPYVSPNG
jgi:hypothetical protein